jgi:hypothetical protein
MLLDDHAGGAPKGVAAAREVGPVIALRRRGWRGQEALDVCAEPSLARTPPSRRPIQYCEDIADVGHRDYQGGHRPACAAAWASTF